MHASPHPRAVDSAIYCFPHSWCRRRCAAYLFHPFAASAHLLLHETPASKKPVVNLEFHHWKRFLCLLQITVLIRLVIVHRDELSQLLHHFEPTSFSQALYHHLDWAVTISMLLRQEPECVDQVVTVRVVHGRQCDISLTFDWDDDPPQRVRAFLQDQLRNALSILVFLLHLTVAFAHFLTCPYAGRLSLFKEMRPVLLQSKQLLQRLIVCGVPPSSATMAAS